MWKKAKRKKRMSEDDPYFRKHPMYDNLHQYSKNTIHCSCPDCQQKTRNKGKRRYKSGNYAPSKNYKHAEYKRIIGMDYDEFEIYIEES
jgi:hypothetical protein